MENPSFPKYVPDWHREAGITLEPDAEPGRIATIEALRSDASAADLVSLARSALGLDSEEMVQRVREVAQHHEGSFPNRGDENIIALIAGITLFASIAGKDTRKAVMAARLVSCAVAAGLSCTLSDDLNQASRSRLASASGRDRQPRKVEDLPTFSRFDITDKARLIHQEGTENPYSSVQEASVAIVKELVSLHGLIGANRKTIEQLTTALDHAVRVNEEQAAILWWVVSRQSAVARRPWSDIPEHARPLVAALELATLTRFATGPAAQCEFLATFAGDSKSVDARSAMSALADMDVAGPQVPDSLEPFVPIWRAKENKESDEAVLSSVELAERAFNECLLLASVDTE